MVRFKEVATPFFVALWALGCGASTTSYFEPEEEIEASAESYEWYTRAEVLRLRGQFDLAIKAYRRALLASDTLDPLVSAQLSAAYLQRGQFHRSRAVITAALEQSPTSEALWNALGNLETRLKNWKLALFGYRRATEVAPNEPSGALNLARLLFRLGNCAAATQTLQRYFDSTATPQFVPARALLMLGLRCNDSRAVRQGSYLIAHHAERFYPRLRALTQQSQLKGVPAMTLAMTDGLRGPAWARRARLSALRALGRYETARASALTHSIEELGGFEYAVETYLDLELFDQASALAEVVARASPAPAVRLLQARAAFSKKNYLEVLRFFQMIPPVADEYVTGCILASRAARYLGLWPLALSIVEEGFRQTQQQTLRLELVSQLLQAQRPELALTWLSGVTLPTARFLQAEALESLGRKEQALRIYRELPVSLELQAHARQRALAERAWFHGRFDNVVELLRSGLRMRPFDLWLSVRLAEAYLANAEKESACQLSRQALAFTNEVQLHIRLQHVYEAVCPAPKQQLR